MNVVVHEGADVAAAVCPEELPLAVPLAVFELAGVDRDLSFVVAVVDELPHT